MKVQNIFLLQFLLLLILGTSCAKLPVYKSSNSENKNEIEIKYPIAENYNQKKNFHFGFLKNDSSLILQIYFHEQSDLYKIISGGLNIYFDNSAEKNKNYVLILERKGNAGTGLQPKHNPANGTTSYQQTQSGFQNIGMQGRLGEILYTELDKVTWKKNDKEFVFYRSTFKNQINVDLESKSPSELIVTVQMPLRELGINGNNLFSIGIETGTKTGNSNSKRPSGNNGMSMSGRTGGGGGRGSRMGGGGGKTLSRGGMNGGSSSSYRSGNSGNQTSQQPFRFWFQVQL